MTSLTPRQIVLELDRYIVGQMEAKRAVAVALRNRWRRMQLDRKLQEEVLPKNILMIGPTGVGKTEIARRLARLAQAPFIKVEATKFTEIGYVGRDVEQIIRDLVETAVHMTREYLREEFKPKASAVAKERILDALVGKSAPHEMRQEFRVKLQNGELDDREVEIEVADSSGFSLPSIDIPGIPGGQIGMINLKGLFGKALNSGDTKTKKMHVKDALETLIAEESEKFLDQEKVIREALDAVQQKGIVFIDEIDKICTPANHYGGNVSREGVQRDLLPLVGVAHRNNR